LPVQGLRDDANCLLPRRVQHDAFVAVTGCGRVEQAPDKHNETALVIAVKGNADYYTLQWAERTPPSAKPAINDAKWLERLRLLQPIRLSHLGPIGPDRGATCPPAACRQARPARSGAPC
jgi:hypothetical protein